MSRPAVTHTEARKGTSLPVTEATAAAPGPARGLPFTSVFGERHENIPCLAPSSSSFRCMVLPSVAFAKGVVSFPKPPVASRASDSPYPKCV